jgi:2-oxoacid:acceptor oxidoreductase delta subunit (pyruvate/2-ketoisovalerate family)
MKGRKKVGAEKNCEKGGVSYKDSRINKTSGWRNFKPIFTERCKGCGLCISYCPEGCISLINKKAKVDYDYCKGCLLCIEICPFKAIEKQVEK